MVVQKNQYERDPPAAFVVMLYIHDFERLKNFRDFTTKSIDCINLDVGLLDPFEKETFVLLAHG